MESGCWRIDRSSSTRRPPCPAAIRPSSAAGSSTLSHPAARSPRSPSSGVNDQTIYNWRRQHLIDTEQIPGTTSSDQPELAAARKRIAELETELAIHRRAAELLGEATRPKGGTKPSA